jgi:acyl-CoA reductase-like NAD-dependent aldehyde dehydrogenase
VGDPTDTSTAQRNHDAPFGASRMSGIGRDGGDYGFLAYIEHQAIIWSS